MIPKIDVRLKQAKKAYVGELAFAFEGDNSLIDLPDTRFSSPVEAALRFEIFEDDTVDIAGTLTFSLTGPCSRCLKSVERTFTAEIDACYEPGEGDGESYGFSNGVVDLSELLRDTLLVALPSRLTCEEECELPAWEL